MGSPPSALGLLGPAAHGWARRGGAALKWALGARRWPEPLRASAAVALAAGDGAWAALLHPALAGPLGLLGGAGVVAVAVGVLARGFAAVSTGAALLGAAYLAGAVGRPVSVVVASAFATVLLLVCELAWWSAELSARSAWKRAHRRRRWLWVSGLAAGGFGVAVVVGLAGLSGVGPGTVVAVAGAMSAVVVALAVASWVRDLSDR